MAEKSEEAEKLTVYEEYEESRKQLVILLQNLPNKTISAEVDGRNVFKVELRDSDTVWVDFMDEYDWMKDDSDMWTMIDADDRKTGYRVSLCPSDKDYLSGKPSVIIKSSDKHTVDLDDVDFNDGRVLEPAATASLDRHYYIKNERDLSSAVRFIAKIFEEKLKKTE